MIKRKEKHFGYFCSRADNLSRCNAIPVPPHSLLSVVYARTFATVTCSLLPVHVTKPVVRNDSCNAFRSRYTAVDGATIHFTRIRKNLSADGTDRAKLVGKWIKIKVSSRAREEKEKRKKTTLTSEEDSQPSE